MIKYYLAPRKHPGESLFAQKTAGSSGFDLCANIERSLVIASGERLAVPTGVHLAMEPGIEAQVRPRSGLARNYGVTVLNTPGTIDADFRGELEVLLVNLGDVPFYVGPGNRIAQVVFAPVLPQFARLIAHRVSHGRDHAHVPSRAFIPRQVSSLDELGATDRGTGGWGSTGT